jgi:hypothetical protein
MITIKLLKKDGAKEVAAAMLDITVGALEFKPTDHGAYVARITGKGAVSVYYYE